MEVEIVEEKSILFMIKNYYIKANFKKGKNMEKEKNIDMIEIKILHILFTKVNIEMT